MLRATRCAAAMLLYGPMAMATPLDDYVNEPDPAYAYSLIQTSPGAYSTDYILQMTSQTWQPPELISQPVWSHIVLLTIPHTVSSSIGLLRIGSGSNTGSPPKANRFELRTIAEATGTVTAEVMHIPNQPLAFEDGVPRTEDDLIAYGWDKFLRGGDPIWLARLPMTKAVVRTMDTLTHFVDQQTQGEAATTQFVVFGASKRGWTTWTTAAVDDRVIAFAPQVIDLLNVRPSFAHHYSALGFWADAIQDYSNHNIQDWFNTLEFRRLLAIVDPYSYLHRFGSQHIFVMNSAGDEFFLPDSSKFYWKDIPGPKHLRYLPNTGHGLDPSAWESLTAWYRSIVADAPLPSFDWQIEADGSIIVDTDGSIPAEVILWQAHNPNARDFNHRLYGNIYTSSLLAPSASNTYIAHVAEPEQGWTAFFIEMRYDNPFGPRHRFTTEVSIVPDTYTASWPFEADLPGDINLDERINAVDVQLVTNAALGIALDLVYNADINRDGAVNAVDVQLVINAALGIAIEP